MPATTGGHADATAKQIKDQAGEAGSRLLTSVLGPHLGGDAAKGLAIGLQTNSLGTLNNLGAAAAAFATGDTAAARAALTRAGISPQAQALFAAKQAITNLPNTVFNAIGLGGMMKGMSPVAKWMMLLGGGSLLIGLLSMLMGSSTGAAVGLGGGAAMLGAGYFGDKLFGEQQPPQPPAQPPTATPSQPPASPIPSGPPVGQPAAPAAGAATTAKPV